MQNLYLIVGRSMAGKDTVTNLVSKKTGLSKVVSYTDAPMRSDQKNGREHWFLSTLEMDQLLAAEEILAYTKIGDYRYCVPKKSVGGYIRLYIIDPNGVKSLRSKEFNLVPFYISVPEEIRRKRGSVRTDFDMEKRLASEDAEFTAFEKEGSFIEIDNSANDPQIAADKIAGIIQSLELGVRFFTKRGEQSAERYIDELSEKRKEILDGWKDTADATKLPTVLDILADIDDFVDNAGDYWDSWPVTDHYDADTPLYLQQGIDFV